MVERGHTRLKGRLESAFGRVVYLLVATVVLTWLFLLLPGKVLEELKGERDSCRLNGCEGGENA